MILALPPLEEGAGESMGAPSNRWSAGLNGNLAKIKRQMAAIDSILVVGSADRGCCLRAVE